MQLLFVVELIVLNIILRRIHISFIEARVSLELS